MESGAKYGFKEKVRELLYTQAQVSTRTPLSSRAAPPSHYCRWLPSANCEKLVATTFRCRRIPIGKSAHFPTGLRRTRKDELNYLSVLVLFLIRARISARVGAPRPLNRIIPQSITPFPSSPLQL